MSDQDPRFRRTADLWRWIQDRVCTDREVFRWGVAYTDLEFPLRYDSNHLFVDRPITGVAAETLHAEAERIQGGAGLTHREIQLAGADDGSALGMGFAELGYGIERLLVMAADLEPTREVDLSVSERVDFATARPGIEASVAAEPWAQTPEVVQQITDYGGKLERAIGARFYVARVEATIAAYCELYLGEDGIAQVEDVNTLERFRGRGLASACVLQAVQDARAEGADLVFLYADADDWPKQLYESLGFAEIGRAWEFLKVPAGHPGGNPFEGRA